MVKLYVPALLVLTVFVVEIATPVGTVHVYVYVFVPVGVNIVIDAVSPSQIIGLVNVGFAGKGFTVTIPVPTSLVQLFASVIVKLYVPALLVLTVFIVEVATPVGTVHVYEYVPVGRDIVIFVV